MESESESEPRSEPESEDPNEDLELVGFSRSPRFRASLPIAFCLAFALREVGEGILSERKFGNFRPPHRTFDHAASLHSKHSQVDA